MGKINLVSNTNTRIYNAFETLRLMNAQRSIANQTMQSEDSTIAINHLLEDKRLSPVSGMVMMDDEEAATIRKLITKKLHSERGAAVAQLSSASPIDSDNVVKANNVPDINMPQVRPVEQKVISKEEAYRKKALANFKAKTPMKARFYGKKIGYEVRQIFAVSRPRVKGRFI